jgi:transcriptional regulator with XRE-family HTH domain
MAVNAHGGDGNSPVHGGAVNETAAKAAWRQSGMQQRELAERAHVPRGWLNMLLSGKRGRWRRDKTVAAMARIARVLGKSYGELWDDTGS